MTSRLMLLAGAAALVLASASAEPPHGCPPGEQHCDRNQQGGHDGPQGGRAMQGDHAMQGRGPQAQGPQAPGPQGGPTGFHSGPAGQVWQGGPGWNKGATDWQWQDNRGSWHRDHDRYWRPEFRGGFAARDRIFFILSQHNYSRFDGEPYWFRGRFVVRTFDRRGRPVMVELNPYTGDFIGIVRF